MKNKDNTNEPLIPESRHQGKTVQTILIKNELKPLKCLYYLLSAIKRDSLDWIEYFLLMVARRWKKNTCMALVFPNAMSQFNVKKWIFIDENPFKWFSPDLGWFLFFFQSLF